MEVTALGMIETSGLLTAIEAADAGLKAAEVRLLGTDYVRGGLVMVRFEGEVAAVRSAVDAGTMAAQRVGHVISSHVIPHAMPEVFCMLASDVGVGPGKMHSNGCAQCGGCEGGMREARACRKAEEEARKKAEAEQKPDPAKPAEKMQTEPNREEKKPDGPAREESTLPTLEELSGRKVVELRSLVRKLPGFGMKTGEIRYANKEQLLGMLKDYIQKNKK